MADKMAHVRKSKLTGISYMVSRYWNKFGVLCVQNLIIVEIPNIKRGGINGVARRDLMVMSKSIVC